MKRSAFITRRPAPKVNPRADEFASYVPRRRAVAVAISDGRARMVVPVPKPEPVQPGKGKPSAAARRWMDAITALGCVACFLDGHPGTPGAVHHLLRGGRRIGHLHTICLCDPGHHQNGHPHKVSRHPWRVRFERQYGTEADLLQMSVAAVERGSYSRADAPKTEPLESFA